jgi:hypothetical protein
VRGAIINEFQRKQPREHNPSRVETKHEVSVRYIEIMVRILKVLLLTPASNSIQR